MNKIYIKIHTYFGMHIFNTYVLLKYFDFFSLQLKCEFTKGPGNMVTCPSFPEIHYDKQTSDLHQHNCAIIVENIQEHHEGKWKCEFEIDAPNEDDPNEPVIVKESVKLLARGYRYV